MGLLRKKQILHRLSIFLFILGSLHDLRLDPECFFHYLLFWSIVLVIPYLWNEWLYERFMEDYKKPPISYGTFILFMNMVYIGICILIIYLILTNYKMDSYIRGVC